MQKLISKYGLAAHLALLAVAPLFLYPPAVLWIAAISVIWVIMEPSRIGGEALHEARDRVSVMVFRDPVFWVSLVIGVFALMRCLNGGVTLAYDAEIREWSLASPSMPLLPGTVNGHGFCELGAAVALIPILQGIRHALGRSARYAFALIVSFLTACGAITYFVLKINGVAFEACPASAFGIGFVLSVVALSAVFERSWLRSLIPAMIAIGGNAVGLFVFASPLVALVFACVALLLFVYSFVYVRITLGNPTEFKFLIIFVLPLVAAYMAVTTFIPNSEIMERIAPYITFKFFSEDFQSIRGCLGAVSLKVWKTHPWIGTGLASFPIDLGYFATAADWQVVPATQQSPLNGYWLLLAERGTIGAFVMLVPLVLMCWTYVRRLIGGILAGMPSCGAFAGLFILLAVLAEAMIDGDYLSPGMITLVAASFAIAASTFPRRTKQ